MCNIKFFLSLLASAIFLLTIVSCKKYLDEKSNKSLVIPQTLTDLQGMLDDNTFMNKQTPGYGETSADDYFLLQNDYNSLNENSQKAYTWTQITQFDNSNDWQRCYYAVYNANYVLEQINKTARNSQNAAFWDNVKGSALFFRSYNFLNLAWTFSNAYDPSSSGSDLGIVLRHTSDFNEKSSRSTVKETYEKIIQDAKEAATLLPDVPQHVMRPSKPAAYGLLARAYLSMRIYDSAFKYSNLVLQSKNDLLDFNKTLEVSPSSTNPFRPFNREVIFYSIETGNYGSKATRIAIIDTSLYNSYDNNDIRKSAYFKLYNGYHTFKGNYTSNVNTLFSGIATDEMYLIRAECSARMNQTNSAISDLDSLLLKRWKNGTFTPLTASSPQQALVIVLTERRKELLMRGLRWIDIKRFNKEGGNISLKRVIGTQTFNLPANDQKFALPLPYDIIQLTEMSQNPGW